MKHMLLALMVIIAVARIATFRLDPQVRAMGFALIAIFTALTYLNLFMKRKRLKGPEKPQNRELELREKIYRIERENKSAAQRAEKEEAWIKKMEAAWDAKEKTDDKEEK